ncbi:hypothetical protein MUJ63_11830 [Lachnospiraceae bacterium NSJ-143]|nr:hypothetical protein [Lachnospiraceae bacterium NSJ-143]
MFLNAIYYMCHVCSVIQGDANAINYTGIVRGGTQKLIKQEIMNDQNDELLKSPDSILEELSYDSNAGKSSLVSIKSEKYQDYIKKMKLEWQEVKEEIKNVRDGKSPQRLYELSESTFKRIGKLHDYSGYRALGQCF